MTSPINQVRSPLVKQIFFDVWDLPTDTRAAEVRRRCGNDETLCHTILSLLEAHDQAGLFLSRSTLGDEAFAAVTGISRPPRQIGPYRILELLGEGGFGTVYLAEQEHPVRRRVAIKIIKLGMDTRQVIARFEAERQALAMMDHPNIAKVFDAGATETGRPYFVMELVAGVPITQYCDANRLVPRQRLELFVLVCHAVQHAHQKGIIHRDIKPSNVLVSLHDGKPVPRVIDFGIAKATAERLTEKTLFTEFWQMIGTPEYMSPEQAEMSGLDIDTRADVYSLGVLLYELLTGTTPFDGMELRSKEFAEIQRIICKTEPPRPSTRLSTLKGSSLPTIAALRNLEPARLNMIVRGDLDWIVMKCIEKDRSRRYESASALAADVMRYLSDEPVLARPASMAYRARKAIRRHKGPVIASALVLVVLIGGIIGTTIGLIGQARQRAIAARQAGIAEAVSQFQSAMLASADPDRLLGDQVTVLQAVTAAVAELDAGKLKDQPLVEAGVRLTIGQTLRALGRYDAAQPNIRIATTLRRQHLGAEHPDLADCLTQEGLLLRDQGHLVRAEPVLRQAMDIYRDAVPPRPAYIALSMSNLGILLQDLGRFDEAEPLLREALEIRRQNLPAGSPDIAASLGALARLLRTNGRFDESEPLLREAVEIYRASLPPGHPTLGSSLANLAELRRIQGRRDEAELLFSEALEIRRKAFPAGHVEIANGADQLARVLAEQGKLQEAEVLFREALDLRRRALPAGHRLIAQSLNNLAATVQSLGQLSEAEQLTRQAVEIYRQAYEPGHPTIAVSVHNLGVLLHAQDKFEESEQLLREALEISRTTYPPENPEIAKTANALARVLVQRGKAEEAEPLLRKVIDDLERTFGKDHWRVAISRVRLGEALAALQRRAEAETELLQSQQILSDSTQAPRGRHRECVEVLVKLYTSWDQAEPENGFNAKATQWRARLSATNPSVNQ